MSGVYETNTATGTRGNYYRGYKYGSLGNELFLVLENHTYFVMYCYKSEFYKEGAERNGTKSKWYKYYNKLLPVNSFGARYADEDAEDYELKVVPAWIEDTGDEHGNMLFLNCGEMGSAESWTLTEDGSSSSTSSSSARPTRTFGTSGGAATIDYDSGALAQGGASFAIAKGENKNTDAYFDNIFVGFWDGIQYNKPYMPHPLVDKVEVSTDFEVFKCPYSLRLDEGVSADRRDILQRIDGKKKYEFSFLSSVLPNPRSIYYIRGGKYVCEKITATFNENGMSQLLKGTFYRVLDES